MHVRESTVARDHHRVLQEGSSEDKGRERVAVDKKALQVARILACSEYINYQKRVPEWFLRARFKSYVLSHKTSFSMIAS